MNRIKNIWKSLRPFQKLSLQLIGAGCAVYTGGIEYKNKIMTKKRKGEIFGPNTADEILMNHLSSGDVILFNRKWYKYHIPAAISILLYQWIHNTEYDHCAVIVCDDSGIPSVYELGIFGKPRLERYPDRILGSKSQQIILNAISLRGDVTNEQRLRLVNYVNEQVKVSNAYPECISMVLGLLYSEFIIVFGEKLGENVLSRVFGRSFECPSAQLVIDCWKQLDIDLSDELLRQRITCDKLYRARDNIEIIHNHNRDQKLSLGETVYIRIK